ncbi:uncharacterized protein [Nicotiana tomentosiformis]|uniref:uncharacterized protein n=1 Tax=Nicotiana tomentosiformis TaxID=4098 RepID=UPI00388CA8F1
MSVKNKEEITKQLGAKVIRVTQYPTWLANVVPLPKKDGMGRVCVDYCDLNKASPKDDFPLPNIHILIDNCAKKLLGFVVSQRGTELDPSKIKVIQELPPPKNKIEVMSLLGRLNYISMFISQLMTTCEPIFKLLKKNAVVKWTESVKKHLIRSRVGQHDIAGKKEQAIYYLSKKFTPYEIQGEWETQDLKLIPYRQCLHDLCQRFKSAEFRNIPRIHNEIADALATLASMLHHPDKTYVDPLHIQVRDQHAYCNVIEEELDGEPLFHDITKYIKSEFKMMHQNSTLYRSKANNAVETDNKNIKKILRKMVQGSRQWHEKLPFALLAYHTTVCTSLGATHYLLIYGTEAIIPTEVEIPSLRIIVETEINDDEWVKIHLEQLSLIDEKRTNMSNSQAAPTHGDNNHGFHGENDNIAALGIEVPQADLEEAPIANPIDVSSPVALNANLDVEPEGSIHREVRSSGRSTQGGEDGGVSLQLIFEILQAQQAAIAQL